MSEVCLQNGQLGQKNLTRVVCMQSKYVALNPIFGKLKEEDQVFQVQARLDYRKTY